MPRTRELRIRVAGDAGGGAKALDQTGRAAKGAGDDLDKLGRDAAGAKQELDQTEAAAKRAGRSLADLAREAAEAGAGVASGMAMFEGAQAAAGAFSGAFAAGLQMEQAQAKLSAQLGATGPLSAAAGEAAGSLYSQGYGGSMDEVSAAVGAVVTSIDGMRTANAGAVEDMTGKALTLASVFDLDVARAAQVAGQMITTGFAQDGAQAMDLLTVSMQKVPAAVREDLVDAIDEYSPFMQTLGLEGEQAMNLLVAGAEKGMFGLDKTGDALKEFTIRATDMSAASKVGFDLLGMSQEDATRRILAGGQTANAAFQEIITGLLSIKDPAKQSQAALALFGTPLEDLNVSEIPAFLSSLDTTQDRLGQVEGAADRAGDTMADTGATKMAQFQRGVEQAMAGLVNAPGILGTASAALGGFGAVVLPIGGDLGGLALAAGGAGRALSGLGGPLGAAGGKALEAGGRFGKLGLDALKGAGQVGVAGVQMAGSAAASGARVVGQLLLQGGRWVWLGIQAMAGAARVAAAWLVSLGPIGIVIAAVAGLVAVIILNWDRIKNAIGAGWNWVKAQTERIWRALPEPVRDFVVSALKLVRGIPGAVGRALGGLANTVTAPFRAAFNGIRNAWNSTVGGRGFTVPAWVPGFGGRTFRIPRFALGGVSAGGLALVGERGPELVDLPAGARVIPNGATQQFLSGRRSPLQSAASELLAHLSRGGRLFEDFSFRGMSTNAKAMSDQLASMFFSDHPGAGFGSPGTRAKIEQFLRDVRGTTSGSGSGSGRGRPVTSTSGSGGGDTIIIDLRGSMVASGIEFERLVVAALERAGRKGAKISIRGRRL